MEVCRKKRRCDRLRIRENCAAKCRVVRQLWGQKEQLRWFISITGMSPVLIHLGPTAEPGTGPTLSHFWNERNVFIIIDRC